MKRRFAPSNLRLPFASALGAGILTIFLALSLVAQDDSAFKRNSAEDFDTLKDAKNLTPWGIWSDGTTMWVSEYGSGKLFAYSLKTKERDADSDFDTPTDVGNDHGSALWSDGSTMWVADYGDAKIYAYKMVDDPDTTPDEFGTRDAAKEIDTREAGVLQPIGLWSDGTTMWVLNYADAKVYAYSLSTRARDANKDFDTPKTAGNETPVGLWSDGTTIWTSDFADQKLYAYKMSDKAHDSSRDFNTLGDAGNTYPAGVWSDGTTMWVADDWHGKIFAYNMPGAVVPTSTPTDTPAPTNTLARDSSDGERDPIPPTATSTPTNTPARDSSDGERDPIPSTATPTPTNTPARDSSDGERDPFPPIPPTKTPTPVSRPGKAYTPAPTATLPARNPCIVAHAATPSQLCGSAAAGFQYYFVGPDGNTQPGPLLNSISQLAADHAPNSSPEVELYRGNNPLSGKLVRVHYLPTERLLRVSTYYADTAYSQNKLYVFTINEDNRVSYQAW